MQGGKRILVEFQVTDAKKPILSVGKLCSKSVQRVAWHDHEGGVLKLEGEEKRSVLQHLDIKVQEERGGA